MLRPRIFCDEAAYLARLGRCLDRSTGVAVQRLRWVLAEFPEKATGLDIGIHAGQDASGDFSVMIHLVGPDSYALNKPFENVRHLFPTRFTKHGWRPRPPIANPYHEDFETNRIIADMVSDWILSVWQKAGGSTGAVSGWIFDAEGYLPKQIRLRNGSTRLR